MKTTTFDRLRENRAALGVPCISIYLPTHRHHPDNVQDPIRYRNLVTEAGNSLGQKYRNVPIREFLAPFRALAEDAEFWNHTLDGLAVFGAAGKFLVVPYQRPAPELAVVAESFHLKPLLRVLQSADRYQVLCLSRQQAKLYEGNRDALDELDVTEGVPRTITEALGEELTRPHVAVGTLGGGAPGSPGIHHGQGSKSDEVGGDTERFFRAVDRAVLEHHSRPSGLPLILAALTEHHDLFRRVSHNPFLLAEGVRIDPWSLTNDRLREETWKVVLPYYLDRLSRLVAQFNEARSKFLASGDVSDVSQAAVAGRVGTLLVDADRHVPGTFDASTGRVTFDALAHPEVDDLLDDLAEFVLSKGGEVVVVPSDRMPTDSGVAATYRF
jgi:hypothetical protein